MKNWSFWRLRQGVFPVLLFLSGCGGGGSAASSPADTTVAEVPPPAQILSLDHVTLTLPEKADGSMGGYPARTVKAAELQPSASSSRGYESGYFQSATVGADTGVVLWCPVNGAMSSATSDSPRTEFRHQVTAGVNDSWTVAEGSPVTMQTEFSLLQMPPLKKAVIVAQIHGNKMLDATGASVSAPPLMLVYAEEIDATHHQLRVKVRSSPDAVNYVYSSTVLTRFQGLGEWQALSVSVRGGSILVNGRAFPVDARWSGVGVYFKAGVYLDEVGTDATQGGRVLMRKLAFVRE